MNPLQLNDMNTKTENITESGAVPNSSSTDLLGNIKWFFKIGWEPNGESYRRDFDSLMGSAFYVYRKWVNRDGEIRWSRSSYMYD